MEEMDDHVETSSSSKRQRVCEEEEVEDRISSLPDSILLHILSFLPTEDAVRTVFVPRFRHLWQFLTTLTFDHSKFFGYPKGFDHSKYFGYPRRGDASIHGNFFNFVRHVLFLHQNATIDKFVLKLGFGFRISKQVSAIRGYVGFPNRERSMASEVDCWVYVAMRKKVKVLDLDMEGLDLYKLPSVVFRGKYLVELKLVGCEIKPTGQIQLNCLKRLSMEEIFLNDEIFNKILGGCFVLEELSLVRCYGLGRLGFRNSSIKSLKLSHYPFYEERVEISCPNIESLDITGRLDFVDLGDVSSLVVSSTYFTGFEYSPEIDKTVEALLKNLGHCKAFRPCHSCIMVFSIWQLRKQPGLLFHWKCLEFNVELTKWDLLGISCLLRTSPYLETLNMYFSPVDCQTFTLGDCTWTKPYDFDGGNFWRLQEGTFHCLKYHLKTIKMNGQITGPYVIDIIEYLLKNAMVLEKFEISTQNTYESPLQKVAVPTEQRLQFSQKLLSLPMASPRAVVTLS